MNEVVRLMLVPVVFVSLTLSTLVGLIMVIPPDEDSGGLLKIFESKTELVEFLQGEDDTQYTLLSPKSPTLDSELTGDSGGSLPYSETNVQTQGVDELDIVKTDGEFIYVATRSEVTIVKTGQPEEMEIVSVIEAADLFSLDDTTYGHISGVFVRGDRLVIQGSVYTQTLTSIHAPEVITYERYVPTTVISVLDLGDISNPSLEFIIGISGSDMASRMIGDVVYLVAQQTVWYPEEDNVLPNMWENGRKKEVGLSSVRYDPETRHANSFVNILACDISNGDHESLSIVADWSSTVYMSTQALYFAVQKWNGGVTDEIGLASPEDTNSARTTIYRISTDGLHLNASARGDVRGWLLNQFSMDEHQGHLRVATTTGWDDLENAVYVLDENLDRVGTLEGLAPAERIYSARFVGDTLYLVTFLQVDPLFVIDLSDPARPKVAGELKIPGFSTYLHPVDDSHVLGIGQEDGRVKVSLFDVSNPAAPTEKSKFVIESSFYSEALYDHRAILFDRERELLVIPGYEWVSEWDGDGTIWLNETYYQSPAAYVLKVSLSDGISLRGVITHDTEEYPYYCRMARALYIGDSLYTLSNLALQANLLDDLSYIGEVDLYEYPYAEYYTF
jgi:inhibitor of cysteine peptidase